MKKNILFLIIILLMLLFSCDGDEALRFPFKQGDKYGFIDRKGSVVIEARFAQVRDFRDGLAAVSTEKAIYPSTGKWGFIDPQGNMVIPEIYDGAFGFTEGLASVLLNGKEGYIDKQGNVVIDFIFDGAGKFVNGKAQVNIDGDIFIIDTTGKILKEMPFLIDPNFRDGYTVQDVLIDPNTAWPRLYAYFDTEGEPMTEYRWEYAENFADGYGFVSDSPYWQPKDGSSPPPRRMNYYIDKSFQPAFPRLNYFALDSFSEGLGPVFFVDENAAGFITTKGEPAFKARFFKVYAFSDGMAAVQPGKEDRWGYIDKTGEVVIKPRWTEWEIAIASFKDGLAYIRVPGKDCKGYMNKSGEFVFTECD